MKNLDEKFTAYLRMEPSSERLKAAEDKATALIAQATEQGPQTPELQRMAKHLGTERQQLVDQLRELREKFFHRRNRRSPQHTAATKGAKA
jgi:hypothetical protein